MIRIMTTLVFLGCLISCGQPNDSKEIDALPGQSPSIADTARFISNFASVYEPSEERDKLQLNANEPCVIIFVNGEIGWEIDFRSLNPDEVRLQKGSTRIQVSTANGEETIRCKSWGTDPAAFQQRAEDLERALCNDTVLHTINFYTHRGAEDKAPNVAKALVHLIRECGGKKDMF